MLVDLEECKFCWRNDVNRSILGQSSVIKYEADLSVMTGKLSGGIKDLYLCRTKVHLHVHDLCNGESFM